MLTSDSIPRLLTFPPCVSWLPLDPPTDVHDLARSVGQTLEQNINPQNKHEPEWTVGVLSDSQCALDQARGP